MAEEATKEPVIGDGQCIENATRLINCATTFLKCIQAPSVRRDIQRTRVEFRKVQQDEEACKLLESLANCLDSQGDANACNLLATLLKLCPQQPQGVTDE